MSEFENVTIIKQANICSDGKEIMEILSGDLEVLITDSEGWQTIKGGESFEVPAKSTFSLNVKSLTDHCCSYIG